MTAGIADLTGVRAKLWGAKENHSRLKTHFAAWVEQHANTRRFHIRRDGSWYIVTCEPFHQLDIRLPIIAGDIIHNLRSTFDHIIWQLVLRDGQEPGDWSVFPIYESKTVFLQEVKFRKNRRKPSALNGITVDGDAWTIIEETQPYHIPIPEGTHLALIRRFSNIDKHRTLFNYMPVVGDIREAIGWVDDAVLLEESLGVETLSLKEPAEVVRFRFADEPYPNVHVKGGLSISPLIGESKVDGYVVDVSMFNTFINTVTAVVDTINKLPRVV